MRITQTDQPKVASSDTDPELWVDLHGDALYRYANSRLRDPNTAEEVVQETFLAAISRISERRDSETTRGWLMAILRTKIVDHFRLRARKADSWGGEHDPTSLLFDSQGRWRPSALPAVHPDENLHAQDLWQIVSSCLQQLPQGQADVFVLSVMEEMGSEEICEQLDIQPSTMWTRLHRARLGLARCVGHKWLTDSRVTE